MDYFFGQTVDRVKGAPPQDCQTKVATTPAIK
jgi:hypothetical protein